MRPHDQKPIPPDPTALVAVIACVVMVYLVMDESFGQRELVIIGAMLGLGVAAARIGYLRKYGKK